ncbi:LuxR C-terminal-related transcriptional regulator [Actinoplanes sp. NPDC049118]|uniref:ATP-binding protein n=1 Tax=Actinoplanes sp. NPDC049118 TaxID=3155769 RepID=UPI0033CFAC6F
MLIERLAELNRIGAGLTSARAGRSELLVVRGPAGVGRSALLRRAAGGRARVLRAAGTVGERDIPYGVVQQLFDGISADVDAAGEGDPRALTGLLDGADPALLVVDDLQAADEESLAWLARLAVHRDGLRLMLLCAVRDGDAHSDHPLVQEVTGAADAVLRPAPLSLGAARQLLHGAIGAAVDDTFAVACHTSAAGSPLLLTALATYVLGAGLPPDAEHAGDIRDAVPPELRDRLAGLLAGQGDTVRAIARAVAVLGEQAEPELIGRLAGADAVDVVAGLRALRELGLVARAGRPRFTHPAVRAAAESDLPMAARLSAHEAAAELLHRDGHPAEQVARHLMAVPALHRPWSVDVLRTAAGAAQDRGAPEIAVEYLRRALLTSSEMGPDRAWLLLDLARALHDSDPEAAERLVDQAVWLFDDPRDRAAAALRIAPAVLNPDRPSVVDLFRRVAHDLGAGPAADTAARAAQLGLEARLRQAGLHEPDELSSAVARLSELGGGSTWDSVAERQLVAVLLQAAVVTGGLPAEAVAGLGEKLLEEETPRSAHPQPTVTLAVLALTAADRLEAAARWLFPGTGPAGPRLPVAAEARLDALRAVVLLGRGRLTAARLCAERAAHRAAPCSETATIALGALAWVAMEIQDATLADSVAARLCPDSPAPDAVRRYLRAYADSRRGNLREALAEVLSVGEDLRAAGWRNPLLMPWRIYAAVLQHRLGDRKGAVAVLDEEYAVALSWGAPSQLGRVLRVRGEVEGGPRGTELLRESIAVLRRSSNRLELARALLALGRTCPDTAEAIAASHEGAAIAAAGGAPWLSGATPVGGPSTIDAALTPAERLAASFVVGGLTNQETAALLNVSRRAVEKHLTSCYRKLNVAGRAELIDSLTGEHFPRKVR